MHFHVIALSVTQVGGLPKISKIYWGKKFGTSAKNIRGQITTTAKITKKLTSSTAHK